MSLEELKETKKYVRITFSDDRIVELELYPDLAPDSVANFVKLVNEGFYNGLTIHRIVPGFVIQGGDPSGNGTGGSGTNIKGEFAQNGFYNPLSHKKGVISMARRGNDMNSATSQFFIVLGDQSRALDGSYAAFGQVITGMDVVDSLATAKIKNSDTGEPYEKPVMKTVEEFFND